MPRVVSLFLPAWPTDRIRKRARFGRGAGPASGASPDQPLVTVAKDGSRRVIAAVDRRATELGLRPGQPVAQSQASVPELVVVEATPEADEQGLVDLAGWCLRYAPVVQPDQPDGIFIDITGAAHPCGSVRGRTKL
jgi:protein ImuB